METIFGRSSKVCLQSIFTGYHGVCHIRSDLARRLRLPWINRRGFRSNRVFRSSHCAFAYRVLVGSFINVPLLTLESQSRVLQNTYVSIFGMTYRVPSAAEGSRKTVVAVNVGGALIPSIVSLYLLWQFPDIAGVAIVGVTLVAIVSHLTSRPVAGVGIVSPALVSPLVAAIYTIFVLTQVPAIENGFALAYISGVLGTLIGADITNLNAIKKIGAPVTSIGGAGTFDGVFLSGIIAVLLT